MSDDEETEEEAKERMEREQAEKARQLREHKLDQMLAGHEEHSLDNANVEEVAQQASKDALMTLLDITRNGEESNRIKAAGQLLDRAHGRPRQAIEHSGNVQMTVSGIVRGAWEEAEKLIDADYVEAIEDHSDEGDDE